MQVAKGKEQEKYYQPRFGVNTHLMQMWMQILAQFENLSCIFLDIQDSPNKVHLAGMVLGSFAASTLLFRYFYYMSKFRQVCLQLQVDVCQLTAVQLLGIFLIGSKRTGLDPSIIIKALTWFCTRAEVNVSDIVSHSLVQSWRISKVPRDRRESLLPLHVVIQWERRLLQAGCTPRERLVLGGFLLMIWSGLRFADFQRITHSSLIVSFSEIRGLCWRAKTCSRGQPWGFTGSLLQVFYPTGIFHGLCNSFSIGITSLVRNLVKTLIFSHQAAIRMDQSSHYKRCLMWKLWVGFVDGY